MSDDNVQRSLGKLEADVGTIKTLILDELKSMKERITELEKWKWKLVGASTAGATILTHVLQRFLP